MTSENGLEQDDTKAEAQVLEAENSDARSNASETETSEQALKKQVADAEDRYLRLLADFDNYKKRTIKERSELIKYQGEKIFLDFVEVLDDLDRAIEYSAADYDKLKVGLELIRKTFVDRLAKWEVRPESGVGQDFDPAKHAAISHVASEGAKVGSIIGELKKAYFFKDKLLRAGEVVVAAAAETTEK